VTARIAVERLLISQHPGRDVWECQGRTHAFAETVVEVEYPALDVDPWVERSEYRYDLDVSCVDRALHAARQDALRIGLSPKCGRPISRVVSTDNADDTLDSSRHGVDRKCFCG